MHGRCRCHAGVALEARLFDRGRRFAGAFAAHQGDGAMPQTATAGIGLLRDAARIVTGAEESARGTARRQSAGPFL